MSKYIRHGDVLIEPLKGLPKGLKRLDPTKCQCAQHKPCGQHAVFAHGEVTGHMHQAVSKSEQSLEIFEDVNGSLYAFNPSDKEVYMVQNHGLSTIKDIQHLEQCYALDDYHAPIPCAIKPKQAVKIDFPQEYDWWTGEITRARD